MIECSDLFPDAEWACAHVMGDMVRINVQQKSRNMIFTLHVQIDRIANFLEQCRRQQKHTAPDAFSGVTTLPMVPPGNPSKDQLQAP